MTTSQRQRKKGLCWKLEFFSVPSQSLINLTILRIFPNGFAISCKYIWSVLLSLKFQANTYSFERVVTLFVGYYFSSGHRVYIYIAYIYNYTYAYLYAYIDRTMSQSSA